MNSKYTLKSKFRKKGADYLIEPFSRVLLELVLPDTSYNTIMRAHDQMDRNICVYGSLGCFI